jgi:hypothetical protein
MSAILAAGRRHPVLSYYVLAFAISWGSALTVVGPGGLLGTTQYA